MDIVAGYKRPKAFRRHAAYAGLHFITQQYEKALTSAGWGFFVLLRIPIPPLETFNKLHVNAQIGIVVFEGQFLLNRYDEHGDYINLDSMGSYFAELYYDTEANYVHHCHTFVSSSQLEPYASEIQLPDL